MGEGVSAAISPCDNGAAATPLQSALSECVSRTVHRYLDDIGHSPCMNKDLYALVMSEVETPLLREVLAWHDGNQSRAADMLGISRATLHKKLLAHGLL